MNEFPFMKMLKPFDNLVAKHDCSLKREFVSTEEEQVTQTRTKDIHGHIVELLVLSKIKDIGKPSVTDLGIFHNVDIMHH